MKKLATKNAPTKKIGRNLKEIVPSNYKQPHDNNPIKQPEEFTKVYESLYEPSDLFPEWNETDVITFFNLEEIQNLQNQKYLQNDQLFTDPTNDKIILSPSLLKESQNEIKWRRPNEYIREALLEKDLMIKHPNKNFIKLRMQINEWYKEDNKKKNLINIEEVDENKKQERFVNFSENNEHVNLDNTNNESDIDKWLFKDYFQMLDKKLELKVVEYFDREETDEEFKIRKKLEQEIISQNLQSNAQNILNSNNKGNGKVVANLGKTNGDKKKNNVQTIQIGNPQNIIENDDMKIKIKEMIPTDINMKDKYCNYSKWVASVFQIIKDLNILDVNVNNFI